MGPNFVKQSLVRGGGLAYYGSRSSPVLRFAQHKLRLASFAVGRPYGLRPFPRFARRSFASSPFCTPRCIKLVRGGGLEPPRTNVHKALNLACLPIPPSSHIFRKSTTSGAQKQEEKRWAHRLTKNTFGPRGGFAHHLFS